MKLSKEFIAMFREEARRARWEINSWNGKSIDDLVVDYLQRKELKPEDFTGAVILTAEEAKAIAYKLGYLGALTTQSKTEKETLELTDMLWWRIEQAEMSIASTQCENVSKKDEKIITLTVEQAEKGYE